MNNEPLAVRNDRSFDQHCKALRAAVRRYEGLAGDGEVELALTLRNGRIVRRELRTSEAANEKN